jgi:hypothetical protein
MVELPAHIQRIMLEMQLASLERHAEAVKADPAKHKLTLQFPPGAKLNWRYWQVHKAKVPRVRYCYSTERNLAGYFLCWRETWNGRVGKRDLFVASKRRATVKAKALQRLKAHHKRLGIK